MPVVVGQRTRMFLATGPDIAPDLVDAQTTPNGVTIQSYGRPGAYGMPPPPPT